MPKVKVGDINIYYEVHGRGEPLVMIPGGGTVEGLLPRVRAFADEYQVVAFEARGSGRTDTPDIPYTMEMFADDLAGLIDAIGIDSAHVWGSSFGGQIAQYFALRHPRKVRSLILGSTSCQFARGLSEEMTKFNADLLKKTPQERARDQFRLFVTQEFADKNPDIMPRQAGAAMNQPPPGVGAIRTLQALKDADTYERLPEVKAPTLIIAGEADRAMPVKNSRILAARIPNSELVIFKNAGHLLVEVRDEVNRTVLAFLRRHSVSGAG